MVVVLISLLHLAKPLKLLFGLTNEAVVAGVPEEDLVNLLAVRVDLQVPDGLDARVVLLHDALVRHFLFDLLDALHVRVHNPEPRFSCADEVNLGDLLAVALANFVLPSEAVEVQKEVGNQHGVDQVDEGKTEVLTILKVNRQVEVVVQP